MSALLSRLSVTGEANEDRCIQRARKSVRFHEKWGRLCGVLYLVLATGSIGVGFFFITLVWRFANLMGPNAPNQQQPAQGGGNLEPAWGIGLLLGFIAGWLCYKGAHLSCEAFRFFQGDRANRLLLEYHDAFAAIMQSQNTGKEGDSRS